MLLDLTAAFDLVDHNVVISHLNHTVRMRDTAVQRFQSHLSERDFRISFRCSTSASVSLTSGVPRSLILVLHAL